MPAEHAVELASADLAQCFDLAPAEGLPHGFCEIARQQQDLVFNPDE